MKILKPLFLLLLVSIVLQSCISVKPAGTIKTQKANEYEERYKTTRANLINSSLDYTDTREVWFDLDRVKKYIAYVESQAKKKNYKNLGLRIYLGTYPEDENGDTFTTLFFVPTSKPDALVIGKSNPTIMMMQSDTEDNENIYDIDPLNYGGLGHPPKEYEPENDD